MNVRINNIECRQTIYKTREYELIAWYPNQYYGRKEAMVKEDGYKYVEYDGDWGLSKNGYTINSSCFKNPESCYVVAWLEPNYKEPDVNLVTVGSRLLELSEEDRETFFKVYKIANEMILDSMNKKED